MVVKVCIDTNVFIALMNKESNTQYCELIFNAIEKNHLEAALSTIVIAEILVGFNQNGDNEGKQKFLNKIRLKYEIEAVSLELAELGADIRANTKIKLSDALIYATTIKSNAEVLISNDFPLAKKVKTPILTPKEFCDAYLNVLE
jgi:predicted nucleic acid-binding protein